MKTALLQRMAYIASFHPNLLARQRANKVLRVRYGVALLPRQSRDPIWLSAMT